MENEIRKTVKKITGDKLALEINKKTEFELDEKELRKYIDNVVKETKKDYKY